MSIADIYSLLRVFHPDLPPLRLLRWVHVPPTPPMTYAEWIKVYPTQLYR